MNYKAKKLEEKRREDILAAVPTFINRLLLYLNSGMVLEEALAQVALKYGNAGSGKDKNYFAVSVYELYVSSQQNRENFLNSFCVFSRDSRVKELSRVAGILADSRERGTEMWDKLAEEGEELWAERKRRAVEKMKLAESKMSFPLGLLLIALIIITAAPAMLQMYID